jgi:cation diffusion facilitator CzcD-associated flavoprotein CzcO
MSTKRASRPTSATTTRRPGATACIIGAGAAGLAAAKALADRGIDYHQYERGSMVGGLWQIDNDNGGAAAYESLHLNSSRPLTQFPSYPMPDDWPDYPSHRLIAQYFDDFADHFGLRERITFGTSVDRVVPDPLGGWDVTTSDGCTRHYEHVLVGNGHHGVPSTPVLPGTFDGLAFHAHQYRTPDGFAGKRVLVLGVGNSGMDIACDASRVAEHTFLATRHGVHVLPKYALGRPIDQLSSPLTAHLPFEVERRLYEAIVRIATGRPQDRGLPEPDHRLLGAHPTVSAELYDRVGHGDIVMKPNIARLEGDKVAFVDGSVEQVDVFVYATGYRITLPFLDPSLIDPVGNRVRLYQRVVPTDLPGLWFIGFIQTVGSGIPLMEHQAQWVGDLITGTCVLPDRSVMEAWLEQDARALAKRYVRSDRHTIQVDYWRYIHAIGQERRRRPGGIEASLLRTAGSVASGAASRLRALLPR